MGDESEATGAWRFVDLGLGEKHEEACQSIGRKFATTHFGLHGKEIQRGKKCVLQKALPATADWPGGR